MADISILQQDELQQDRRLLCLCRVEAGCLGPQGEAHIATFCDYANAHFAETLPASLRYLVEPRTGHQQPEVEYRLLNKRCRPDQVERYLQIHGQSLQDLEDSLDDRLIYLIERYFDRA